MIICFIGDSLTLGYGDETGTGWTGRVVSDLMGEGMDVTGYNLGVRADTTTKMRRRWRGEADLRNLPGMDLRIVMSFGVADVANSVPLEKTLENAEAMLSEARTVAPVLMIGPTPVLDADKCARVKMLSSKFRHVCQKLDLPYVPVFESLSDSEEYRQALNDFDTVHPAGDGYETLTRLVMQTQTVRTFFGLEQA